MKHYKGFIEVASCLASLRQEVAAMSSHLAVLQDDFPALSEACESFTAEAKQHLARRTQNKQLQSELLPSLDPLQFKKINNHALQCFKRQVDMTPVGRGLAPSCAAICERLHLLPCLRMHTSDSESE